MHRHFQVTFHTFQASAGVSISNYLVSCAFIILVLFALPAAVRDVLWGIVFVSIMPMGSYRYLG